MVGNFPAVFNCNRLFLKLNRFIYNWFSPIIGWKYLSSDGEDFWAWLAEIRVFASPTGGYMLTSSSLSILIWGIFHKFLLVIVLKSQTSTGYFSNSTGSSVTNRRFSPVIALEAVEFDESLIEVQDFGKSTHCFRRIRRPYLKLFTKEIKRCQRCVTGWT